MRRLEFTSLLRFLSHRDYYEEGKNGTDLSSVMTPGHLPFDRILSDGAGRRQLIPVAGESEEKDVRVIALRPDVPAKVLRANLLLSPFYTNHV